MSKPRERADVDSSPEHIKGATDYRLIFSACTNPMAFTEAETGSIVDVNPAWLAATGMARERVIGQTAFALGLWPDGATRQACLAELKEKGCLADFELDLVLKSVATPHLVSASFVETGGKRYALWEFRNIARQKQAEERINALLSKSEESRLALLGMLQDVRRTQEQLRESEERFDLAMRAANDGLWDWNLQTRAVYFSPRWKSMLGYADSELENSFAAWEQLVDATDHARILALIEDCVAGRADGFSVEFCMRHKAGHKVHILARSTVIRDANGVAARMVGTHEDITERKRSEQALQESLSLLQSVVENAPVRIFWKDRDSRYLGCNRLFARDAGCQSPDEVVGKLDFELGWKECAEAYRADDREVIETGMAKLRYEELQTTVNGEQLWLSTAKTPLLRGREVIGVLGIYEDITEQKRLEAQLREAQKLEAIGQLAGGVAHDFNNILSAIMMQLGLMQMNPATSAETRQSLKELHAEAKRAASLTRQLLMFSRRSVLDVKPQDLKELAANLLKMLTRLIGENVKLNFECGSVLPLVEADASMVEQVLMNLVVNARDAMPKGGRISINTYDVELTQADLAVHAERRAGRFVCLAVTDTGCGMEAETMERIFEPFFTTKEAGKGTGLGLATVHGIVAQHKGWVEVESVVNRGTTFRVFFPAIGQVAVSVADQPEHVPPVPRGKETILLVEDEPNLRQALGRTLRVLGYAVHEASNGQEAMRLWQSLGSKVDLLFTDMVMTEEMTGLELAQILRSTKPGLKVVISSGYSAEMAQAGVPDIPGIHYLPKPFQTEELANFVRKCLDECRDRGS